MSHQIPQLNFLTDDLNYIKTLQDPKKILQALAKFKKNVNAAQHQINLNYVKQQKKELDV